MSARASCLDSPQLILAAQLRFGKRLVGRHKLHLALIALIMAAFESPALFGGTYVVNSTADEPDADPADDVCQTASGSDDRRSVGSNHRIAVESRTDEGAGHRGLNCCATDRLVLAGVFRRARHRGFIDRNVDAETT